MRILLVRLRLIGDVIFTTPAIRALRRTFPAAHLSYLVEAAAAPVVAGNPHLSEVIAIPLVRGWRRIGADLKLARQLRAGRFDIAIDFHGGPRSAWLTWASRAPRRVGYDVPGRSWMYTDIVDRPRTLRARHSVQNQWDLLAKVDPALAGPPSPDLDRVEMPVDARADRGLAQRLAAWHVPPGAQLIVLHVSAGNPFRRWPEAHFSDLAAALVRGGGNRFVLLTGGPSDRDATRRVAEQARSNAVDASARIIDAEGLSLPELRALFDRAALFVGGDSGPLHMASASAVPIVGLYGPTLPERSAPWRPRDLATASVDAGTLPCRPCEQRVCVPGDFRCLTGIPAARVLEAAERLLASSS